MNSFIDFAGLDGGTTKMFGVAPTCAMAAISLEKSYGSFAYSAGANASEIGQKSSVSPSGVAFAAAAVAIVLPAPGRFSTITGLPQSSLSRVASTGPTLSVGPPAAG